MKQNIIKMSDNQVTNWSGGKTRELFIFPPDGDYAKREFDYRVSSATVTLPQTTFSHIEGYERILMVLEGEIVLIHQEKERERKVKLSAFEQTKFSGSDKTKCIGLCVDFNLIYRPEYHGSVLPIQADQNYLLKPATHYIFYCLRPMKLIIHPSYHMSTQLLYLKKGDSLFLSDIEAKTMLSFQSDGHQNNVDLAVVVELLKSR